MAITARPSWTCPRDSKAVGRGARAWLTRAARVAVATAIAASASTAARADDDGPELLRRGVKLRRDHRDRDALLAFQAALRRDPTPVSRAQAALAEQALGEWTAAESDLALALASADADAWIRDNAAPLRAALAEIREHLGWLTIDVRPPDATVLVDGRGVVPGAALRVESGARRIEARAPGWTGTSLRVDASAGAIAHVQIVLAPDAALRPLPPAATVPARLRSPPLGAWALGGVGAAALATGAYFGIRTIEEKNARDAPCSGGSCGAAAMGHDAAARTDAAASTATFGVGLAALAAAFVWWAVDSAHPSKPPSTAIAF